MTNLFISEIRLHQNALEVDETQYPFSLPVVRHLQRLSIKSPVTFLVGENGTGKSTLLEAIACNYGFNPEGGSKNFHFSTKDTHSELHQFITLVKGVKRPRDGYFLRAESFYNVVSEMDEIIGLESAYGGVSLHCMSHGESFLTLLTERFYGNGLYLLDEPEAALSPARQMAVLTRLHDLVKQRSQLIIATHSPILLAYPNAQIFELTEDGIYNRSYQETEHYQLTKQFLGNPEGMLKILLEEE